VTQLKNKFQK